MRRQPMVVGNWKMNGSREVNQALLRGLVAAALAAAAPQASLAVAPPYPYLAQAASVLSGSGIAWGAQDVAAQTEGAFTGEVSAAMLVDVGCQFALVGHSERRALFAEGDQVAAAKARAALAAGLTAIVCVGETLAEREAGTTEAVLSRQIKAIGHLPEGSEPRLVVAYEPVWAIGTGRTASPELAQAAHAFIRQQLGDLMGSVSEGTRILYGGSVKPDNAAALFAMPDIDGGLIGGASLNAADFLAIWRAAG